MDISAASLAWCLFLGIDGVILDSVAGKLGNLQHYLLEYKHHVQLQGVFDQRFADEIDPKRQAAYYASLSIAWTWGINWLRLDAAFRERSRWLFTENPEARAKYLRYLTLVRDDVRRQFGPRGESRFLAGELPHLERGPGATLFFKWRSYVYKAK